MPAAVLWTIGYDTIYALQDKEDDALIGVRSTARLFGRRSRPASWRSTSPLSRCWAIAFVLADAGLFAFAGLGAGLLHAVWLVATLDPDDPAELPGALSRQPHDRLDRLRRPAARCAAARLDGVSCGR